MKLQRYSQDLEIPYILHEDNKGSLVYYKDVEKLEQEHELRELENIKGRSVVSDLKQLNAEMLAVIEKLYNYEYSPKDYETVKSIVKKQRR